MAKAVEGYRRGGGGFDRERQVGLHDDGGKDGQTSKEDQTWAGQHQSDRSD